MGELVWKVIEWAWPSVRPHRKVVFPCLGVGFLLGAVAGGLLLYAFVYVRVESVNSELKAAKSTVSNQQEIIGRYEMRLGINKESLPTSYGSLSNAQLKQRASNLVTNYRSMKTAHEQKTLDLKARHERGEFPSNKLTEFTASEELRVSDEYESTIHNDAILALLELRIRIPEKDRSGIIYQFSLNPADPRGQPAPVDQVLPVKMAFMMSGGLIHEMDLLAKLLKD